MKTKVVLFDLDGTLLPMDQDVFVKAYFGLLAKKLEPHGYDPSALIDAIWKGTKAMIKNNGEKTNEMVFWDKFAEIFGEEVRKDEPLFAEYYEKEFDNVRSSCKKSVEASEVVKKIKEKGLRMALATNPIFPSIATEKRIAWAGLSTKDFEHYTTYENSRFCKPNPKYYFDIIEKLGVKAEECLMVGNDVNEDMITKDLGMKVFLLTNCLINKEGKDISLYPQGGFNELLNFIEKL